MFKTKDSSDENLKSIQITYANVSKPSTRWTSELDDEKNFLKQRYTDTQLYSGKFWSEGGCEPFKDWVKRGGLYHFAWERDKDDKSTNCQLAIQYGALEANANVFICAHYTRVVSISIQNGFITDVQSLSA